MLEVGNVRVHGTSINETQIAHIVENDFTLPPPPQWTTVTYDKILADGVQNFHVEIIFGLLLLLLLVITCCIGILYLKR
uniref:Uncharacterized protein n=1 Tax=Panagrolaimus sp. ES5 TaxID=591445 RepID=A0AC34FM61_9BILA